jgi:hypothetical protein
VLISKNAAENFILENWGSGSAMKSSYEMCGVTVESKKDGDQFLITLSPPGDGRQWELKAEVANC